MDYTTKDRKAGKVFYGSIFCALLVPPKKIALCSFILLFNRCRDYKKECITYAKHVFVNSNLCCVYVCDSCDSSSRLSYSIHPKESLPSYRIRSRFFFYMHVSYYSLYPLSLSFLLFLLRNS